MIKIVRQIFNLMFCVYGLFEILLVLPGIFGLQVNVVTSGSMEPAIRTGSIIYVKWVSPSILKEGDTITYRIHGNTTQVTHRVVKNNIEQKYLITKGDANDINDAHPVSYTDVQGKVLVSVPWLGWIGILLVKPRNKVLTIFAYLSIIILYKIFSVIVDEREN